MTKPNRTAAVSTAMRAAPALSFAACAAIAWATSTGCKGEPPKAEATAAPDVDPSIAVPDGGGPVLLRVSAKGGQRYVCGPSGPNGAYAWSFAGPLATLRDEQAGVVVGRHFASDAGASAPEWESSDGTFVVGKKVAAFTPDGGGGAVPWLLLSVTSHGGAGPLAKATYVQRLHTTGGAMPDAAECTAERSGAQRDVPYTADYVFYGP